MKTNEIKNLLIKRIAEGGFGNQWLYLTVIGDSDCCLMLGKQRVNLIPEYNVGSSYYSDLFIFNTKELEDIHFYFLEELAKVFKRDEYSVCFYGWLYVDTQYNTLKLVGELNFWSESSEKTIFELASNYETERLNNQKITNLPCSRLQLLKLQLIDELRLLNQLGKCEIYGFSEVNLEKCVGTEDYVYLYVEIWCVL